MEFNDYADLESVIEELVEKQKEAAVNHLLTNPGMTIEELHDTRGHYRGVVTLGNQISSIIKKLKEGEN